MKLVTCQECAMGSSTYVPCFRPAKVMIGWKGRDATPIPMCEMCADHNTRNRGAIIVDLPLANVVFDEPASSAAPAPEPAKFKIGDMIAKYREIEAMVDAANEAHKAQWQPYSDAMNALKTACGAELVRTNQQNARSADEAWPGMAYLKKSDSVTVTNRDDFVKFVLDGHLDFLDARVLKDPVRAWVDQHEAPPPGVKIEPSVTCIIRK